MPADGTKGGREKVCSIGPSVEERETAQVNSTLRGGLACGPGNPDWVERGEVALFARRLRSRRSLLTPSHPPSVFRTSVIRRRSIAPRAFLSRTYGLGGAYVGCVCVCRSRGAAMFEAAVTSRWRHADSLLQRDCEGKAPGFEDGVAPAWVFQDAAT